MRTESNTAAEQEPFGANNEPGTQKAVSQYYQRRLAHGAIHSMFDIWQQMQQ